MAQLYEYMLDHDNFDNEQKQHIYGQILYDLYKQYVEHNQHNYETIKYIVEIALNRYDDKDTALTYIRYIPQNNELYWELSLRYTIRYEDI